MALTNRERFLIGGVGGLAPVLLFLATGDFQRFFSNIAVIVLLGYLVRVAILFFIGGFTVSLYREEQQRMKIFQLGLGAPAMIAGFLSSGSPTNLQSAGSASAVAVVYAETEAKKSELKRFTLPTTSPVDQFFQGLIGTPPKNVWFVIAGSFTSLDYAKAYAKQINDSGAGYHADVYAPYHDNPNYSVVIGAHLSQTEAKSLRDKAVRAGLTRQMYYKTFPDLPPPDESK